MKLKSLILGSVAAAGLSTAGYAADLGVLTSLDVCDTLGLSGLTLSSDTNCLQITGGVSYEFIWGDYRTEDAVARTFDGTRKVPVNDGDADWATKVEAWLKFVGTAPSDFGPASAVIKLKETDITRVNNTVTAAGVDVSTPDNDGKFDGVQIDEAYVSIGDATVIMAGRKGSIANLSDDEPFNFLGLFNSDAIDGKGILVDGDTTYLGGHVIQVVSDLGNGVSVGVGLENLNGDSTFDSAEVANTSRHGTLVGVVSYAGAGVTAHVTGAALGILDGDVESWFVHAGASGTFDVFKVRGAVGYWEDRNFADIDVLNALVSAEATFDLFKIALSGEVANVEDGALGDYTDYGVGGSVGVAVTEGVAINLGARYFYDDLYDLDTTQVALQAVAAVTETIKLTGEVGAYFGDGVDAITADDTSTTGIDDTVYYGAAELAWAPGGGFTSSLKGEVFSTEAYKVTFKAAKSFE
ncbi:hypothetical protein [Devosia sp. RR2S18]|uniref:hypothetical protein n=1 Tax=Devosia rhizosphaerae TaxID=3049774 RepID=UPI00254184CE|nr:hypothetical protein [Devosia sp. RR2S18]WIJ24120.1 hypothetical protein QOV41_13990 [Devosia sp. RR2S18]